MQITFPPWLDSRCHWYCRYGIREDTPPLPLLSWDPNESFPSAARKEFLCAFSQRCTWWMETGSHACVLAAKHPGKCSSGLKVVLVTQSCLTLWDPTDCSPPDSSVHRLLQARTLEWVAIPFSRESFRPRDRTQVSCMAGGFFTDWATSVLFPFTQWTYQISAVTLLPPRSRSNPLPCAPITLALLRPHHSSYVFNAWFILQTWL